MSNMYILDGKNVIPCQDILEWGKTFESQNRVVAKYKINNLEVSTVFLGIDHGSGIGAPIVFETMVFGGDLDMETERYSTWEEAEKGHTLMVKKVKNGVNE